MKKQCVRCWVHIEDWLWCEKCRELVDEEINGETSRPFDFYFKHYIKTWKSNAKIAEKK